mgnify:CR=1 FL=1
MKPFRILAVPKNSPAEAKSVPEWITVWAEDADSAMQKFIKERSKNNAKLV